MAKRMQNRAPRSKALREQRWNSFLSLMCWLECAQVGYIRPNWNI